MTGRQSADRRLPRRRYLAAALAGLVTLGVLCLYGAHRDAAPFARAEGELLNWRFLMRGAVPTSTKVALVIVDDKSIAALKGWPFSRQRLAEAVTRLSLDGARAIAIDLILTPTGRRIDPDGDTRLLVAMGRHKRVVLPLTLQFRERGGTPPPGVVRAHAIKSVVLSPGIEAVLPVPPIGILAPTEAYLAVGGAGHVNFFFSRDGSVRWMHVSLPFGPDHYPALPIQLYRLFHGVPLGDMTAVLGEGMRFGDRFVETDARGRIGVNYLGPKGTIPRVSLIDLLQGRIERGFFKDRAVLIGVEASGVGDTFGTPFERRLAGVALLATVTDNLLENRWIRRGDTAMALDLAAMALLGIVVVVLLAFGLAGPAILSLAGAAIVWPVASQLVFEQANLWVNLAFPLLQMLILAGLSILFLLFGEHRARRRAEVHSRELGRFVSPLVDRHLAGRLGRPARRRGVAEPQALEATSVIALFVDIRGFTGLSQDLAPAELAGWMRRFHALVEDTVARYGGVVDKYVGDGVLALFGVGGATSEEAARAVECAESLAARGGPSPAGEDPVRLAVGLHIGPVAIEVMGGASRAEVSAAGDTVNVASRLQDLTRELDVDVVASEAVIEAARAASLRIFDQWEALPPRALRGREGTIVVMTWRAPRLGETATG